MNSASGSGGSLLLGVWALFSTEIFFCFTCNLNAILLAPTFDTPVDTACQVLQHQLVTQRMRFLSSLRGP
jgi:hypothetical protein